MYIEQKPIFFVLCVHKAESYLFFFDRIISEKEKSLQLNSFQSVLAIDVADIVLM